METKSITNDKLDKDELKLNLSSYILAPSRPKPACIIDFINHIRDFTLGAFRNLKISDLPIGLITALKEGTHLEIMEFIGLIVVITFHVFGVPQDQILYQVCCDSAYRKMRENFMNGTLQSMTLDEIVVRDIENALKAVAVITIRKPKTEPDKPIKPWLN